MANRDDDEFSLGPVPSVADEFVAAELGHPKRSKRLLRIVEKFGNSPGRSLPEIAGSTGDLEAFYRFFNNKAFGFKELMEPHIDATGSRAAERETTLVIHDASEFSYPLRDELRTGFDRLGNRQGFKGLASLALSGSWDPGDGSIDGRPLGLLAFEVLEKATAPEDGSKRAEKLRKRRARKEAQPRKRKLANPTSWGVIDADTWLRSIAEVEGIASGRTRLIHVIDREGDALKIFHKIPADFGSGLVIRTKRNRRVELDTEDSEKLKITELATKLESKFTTHVPLSERTARPGLRTAHPSRAERLATLSFSAAPIRVERSWDAGQQSPELPKFLSLNLVLVREIDPPAEEEPIEWFLLTNEPIDTEAQVRRVIEIYRARWRIEEFFKALKTGCSFEKRQLESRDALLKVLAISLVVAWRSLLLRHESRKNPDAPATTVFTGIELAVLRGSGPVALPEKPTVRQALLAVAAIGGHIKNNGDPGWLVISRGMERLLERVVGGLALLGSLTLTSDRC